MDETHTTDRQLHYDMGGAGQKRVDKRYYGSTEEGYLAQPEDLRKAS